MSNSNRIRNRLHLDPRHGWIAGVCAGVANHLHTDPAIVRVAVVVTGLFLPKIVIAAYLVAWLVLDAEPRAARRPR
jgi:phage shock protein C